MHSEICAALDDEGIPYKTVRREDHLFNIAQRNAFQIGVPFSLFGKAEVVIKEVLGDDTDVFPGFEQPEPGSSEAAPEMPEEPSLDSQGAQNAERPSADWDPEDWYPEDATLEVWSGDDSELATMIEASLRENQIHSRTEELAGGARKLFVLPKDEARAREIVREVVEASPPE
jgi:hypothetical protein